MERISVVLLLQRRLGFQVSMDFIQAGRLTLDSPTKERIKEARSGKSQKRTLLERGD